MTDYYRDAVLTWQQANKNLKNFSACCAMVDGKQTAALASDCGLTPDSIEQYRNVYSLYYRNMESEPVRKLWELAPMHIWRVAVKLQSRYDLTDEQVIEYIETGKDMTRQSFMAHIECKESTEPQWIRRFRSIGKTLSKMLGDWMTEIPAPKRERFQHAADEFAKALQEIVSD